MEHAFLSTIDVARVLNCSGELVRMLARSGRLPCETTPGGRRIFRAEDVRRLADERNERATDRERSKTDA